MNVTLKKICKIDKLMLVFLESGCVKQKKQIVMLKQTEIYAHIDVNALRDKKVVENCQKKLLVQANSCMIILRCEFIFMM